MLAGAFDRYLFKTGVRHRGRRRRGLRPCRVKMKPPRSKTTEEMLAAFERSAISAPTFAGVLGVADLAGETRRLVLGRGGGERLAGLVVDQLGVDVLVGEVHGEARPRGGARRSSCGCGGGLSCGWLCGSGVAMVLVAASGSDLLSGYWTLLPCLRRTYSSA